MTENIHHRIIANFGREVLKTVRKHELTARKIARYRNHLRFNLRCLSENITPRSVRLKSNVKGYNALKILKRAERQLINERVKQSNFQLSILHKQFIDESEIIFTTITDHDLYDRITAFIRHVQLQEHGTSKQRQIGKFNQLKDRQRRDIDNKDETRNDVKDKWVKNLSDRDLTPAENSVLSRGFGFAVTPNSVPVVEFITATEEAIKRGNLQTDQAEELRSKVCNSLCNSKKPVSNLPREEREALKTLRDDDNIVCLPADKGKCVVVLNHKDYTDKCLDLLNDQQTYKRIGYNPTSGFRKKTVNIIGELYRNNIITDSEKFRLSPPSEPSIPAFYGLPKIHKPDPIPVRPIVSSIGSVTYNIAKFVAKIIGPLVGRSEHHIKNSQDFVNKIENLVVEDNERITSYDVSALFTCIPPDEALRCVRQCLEQDPKLKERTNISIPNICELLSLCLKTTYFSFDNQFYLQQHGCAMGSPVSPIVVNLYMEEFETKALCNYTGTRPKMWLRYVDDTFVVLDEAECDNFFAYINQCDPNISFTQEASKDNSLPFLDCLVTVKEKRIRTDVYRKPTHTDYYLQFDSNHPLIHKLGVIRTMDHRANTVPNTEEGVKQELTRNRTVLKNCGYPEWAFHKAEREHSTNRQSDAPATKNTCVTIPYLPGVSDRVKSHLRKYGISVTG